MSDYLTTLYYYTVIVKTLNTHPTLNYNSDRNQSAGDPSWLLVLAAFWYGHFIPYPAA